MLYAVNVRLKIEYSHNLARTFVMLRYAVSCKITLMTSLMPSGCALLCAQCHVVFPPITFLVIRYATQPFISRTPIPIPPSLYFRNCITFPDPYQEADGTVLHVHQPGCRDSAAAYLAYLASETEKAADDHHPDQVEGKAADCCADFQHLH